MAGLLSSLAPTPTYETLSSEEIQAVLASDAETTETQTLVISDEVEPPKLERTSGYSVEYMPPPPAPEPTEDTPTNAPHLAPPNITPDPGSAQAEAWTQVQAHGWGQEEFNCLVALWNKESGWRVNAMNPSSGAYGIPQSLPGNKMASAGADWQTNPATQISWGLSYISDRYGTPCGAWAFSGKNGWY